MQRTKMLEPDLELELRDGSVIGVVSREAIRELLSDMEAVLDVAGGGFTVVTQRAETGVPGERVTTGVMVQWQERTNARPQPEQDGPLLAPQAPPQDPVAAVAASLTAEDIAAILAAREAREAAVNPPAPQVPEPVDGEPVLSVEEAARAIAEGIPHTPPAVHPDEPSDPEAEDLTAIPEHAR